MTSVHLDQFAADHLPPREQWPALRHELPELRYPAHLNCGAELLDAGIDRFGGDRRCLVTDTESWSYAELRVHADGVARVLVDELGVVPGNRVLLRGPNTPWLVACWFAVMKVGAVAVSTMPLLRASELATIVELARPSAALCDARFLEELEAAATPEMRIARYGGGGPRDLVVRAALRPDPFEAVRTDADDICLIAFTSGTTGRPKGCMHAHRDVLAIADTFSRHVVRPGADDLFVTSPPLAFTYGLGGMVVFPMRAGAASLLLERATPDLLAAAVERHHATVCFTAPTAYKAMLRLPLEGLGSLRRCVSAGEHLPRAVWEAWERATGLRIIDGIGSTEMLHIFISAADGDIRPGATGRAVPGYEARVVDEQGVPVPDGCVGRLAVRGPTGCRYLADERQRTYVQDGWNITGDAYIRDADGYFWFQARADDMIISSGYNIAGPEVEEALLRHPDVLEVAVVGVPDADRGSVVKACVVLREGVARDAATAAELQAFVKRTIAPYKYPRQVEFLDSLPRTATGKLQRYRLRPGPGDGPEMNRAA
ncbi:MAG TPA: benzoate-CoA ligase family protein [Candidatus Dormibacteraeota bacterium]|nr:benzoate-CoA ligase family protein [Candidatus Dormibacteraeota bacterium]